MEPFGLFHFLQSLLNQAPKTEQPIPEQQEEEKAEETPVSEKEEEKINACAAFLENHDARARRIKNR